MVGNKWKNKRKIENRKVVQNICLNIVLMEEGPTEVLQEDKLEFWGDGANGFSGAPLA